MKELYRDPYVPRKVSHVNFSLISPADISQLSHVRVSSHNMYIDERSFKPRDNGLLDPRMGTSSKKENCVTCGQDYHQCMGHFGYMDVNAPVYHVGYLWHTVKILQSICKTCSRVLLTLRLREKYLPLCTRPELTYLQKKALRTKIHNEIKKIKICIFCGANNGVVKKAGLSHVIYDVFRSLKKDEMAKYLQAFDKAGKKNPDLMDMVKKGLELIRPVDAMNLFSRIPSEDLPFLLMSPRCSHPSNLIMTRVLVPPNAIRPSVVSDIKLGSNEDDLTVILQTALIYSKAMELPMKTTDVLNSYDNLHCEIARYINSEVSGVNVLGENKKFVRGLVQRLKGKQGRFRGNLSGKRANFTARTVISPDPNMRIDEVVVPIHCAKILTYPDHVTTHNISWLRERVRNGAHVHPGAVYVIPKDSDRPKKRLEHASVCEREANSLRLGDIVERHLVDGDVVLFNRQPSLHRLSIQSFKAVVKPNRTFRFNECCCGPFNADFDGDEMNLHLPQTEEARAEAQELMASKRNIITPRNGEPLIAAIQDFITGAYLLTQKDVFLNRNDFTRIIGVINTGRDLNTRIEIPKPAIIWPLPLWTGKQLFSLIIRPNKKCPLIINLRAKTKSVYESGLDLCPNDGFVVVHNSELLAGSVEKRVLGGESKENIFYILLRDHGGEACADVLWRLTRVVPNYLSHRGFSIGLEDVTPGNLLVEEKAQLIKDGFLKCENYLRSFLKRTLANQPGCSVEQTLENMMSKELSEIRDLAGQACKRQLRRTNAPLNMAKCGSKGSFLNISQMTACVGQQVISGHRVPDGFEGRSLPHFPRQCKTPEAKGFVGNSFYSGLTPTEFFFHTMSGREGLVDTAVKTADTGYMQRRLVKALEDLCVSYDMTVRTSKNEVVQFVFGSDNLDPCELEETDSPVNFERILHDIRSSMPCPDEEVMTPEVLDAVLQRALQLESFQSLNEVFINQLTEFLADLRKRMCDWRTRIQLPMDSNPVALGSIIWQVERLTPTQLRSFLVRAKEKYERAIIEPGCPVGAICGQSIGEPATQMTLKTFHFAGVASMNITQGVPRIREIINAAANISTPIITTYLINSYTEKAARQVKARVEQTRLGEISLYMDQEIDFDSVFVRVKLCLKRIEWLELPLTTKKIADIVDKAKTKNKIQKVETNGDDEIYVVPIDPQQIEGLKTELESIVVCGLPKIRRSVIHREGNPPKYKLFIEGDNYKDVLATYGVNGISTRTNNIAEVAEVLGIEAARKTIIDEMLEVMKGHGVKVDMRHVMLLADLMTYKGAILGYQRYGIAKLKESVFMLASFEKTSDHLFEAAYHGQTDELSGVSESIILGNPIKLGTGLFNLITKPENRIQLTRRPLIFDI